MTPEQLREARAFIRDNLPLTEVPGTGLRLHLAHPRSGLSRLVPPGGTPYWAHAWPGGVALAMFIASRPRLLRHRRNQRPQMLVRDLGAGSGLVALAAARAGHPAIAIDQDPLALLAAGLNAEANGVRLLTMLPVKDAVGESDATLMPSVVTVGDMFYDAEVAAATTARLDALPHRRALILVGDIGRRFLPRDRLEPLVSYPVRDVGDPPSAPLREGWVFRWKPRP